MLERTDIRWPGYVRSLAFTCWAVAFALTAILGWSAWDAYRDVSNVPQYAGFEHEAGLAAPAWSVPSIR